MKKEQVIVISEINLFFLLPSKQRISIKKGENLLSRDVWEYFLKIYENEPFVTEKMIYAKEDKRSEHPPKRALSVVKKTQNVSNKD